MVMDQIRQIDTSGDNQIDLNELVDTLKPNWFLSKELIIPTIISKHE